MKLREQPRHHNLLKAQLARNDEFYTRYEDIDLKATTKLKYK